MNVMNINYKCNRGHFMSLRRATCWCVLGTAIFLEKSVSS